MSHSSREGSSATVRDAEAEVRYRAATELDPADKGDRARLIELLADPSWRVRAAVVDRIGSTKDPSACVAALVPLLDSADGIGAREAVASALAIIGEPAVSALRDRLLDPSPEVRQAAATVLGRIGSLNAEVELVARLGDEDTNVRVAAADALSRTGGEEARLALRQALEASDPALRLAAVEGLASLRDWPEGLDAARLIADPALRCPAYRLLGSCDDESVIGPIAQGLCERSRSAREAALAAVGQQRARRGFQSLSPLANAVRAQAARDPSLPDSWAHAVSSEEPFVTEGALVALGWAGEARHLRVMLEMAEDESHLKALEEALEAMPQNAELKAALADAIPELGPTGRVIALTALARQGSPAALMSLVQEASDPESGVQGEAISALGRLTDLRVVPPLAGLLADEQPAVSSVAASALGRVGRSSNEARATVLVALRARLESRPSPALFQALGALGDASDLEHLRPHLASTSAALRVAAAGAFASVGGRDFMARAEDPDLLGLLADPSAAVRAAAARAVASLLRASVAPEKQEKHLTSVGSRLAAALHDPEPTVRSAAAEGLGASLDRAYVPALEALAEDTSAPVIVAALRALISLGASPVDTVKRLGRCSDPEVVKEAVDAAARMKVPEVDGVLFDAAVSSRWDVRRAAALGLRERGDPAHASVAERLSGADPDPLVARAFAETASALRKG